MSVQHTSGSPPPLLLGIAGFSGAGKTSLLERAVPLLVREGLRVGYLKADAHRIDLDREGKDTERLRRAGAASIAIEGRGGAAHFPVPPEGTALGPHLDPPVSPRTGRTREDVPPFLRDPRRTEAMGHAARAALWNLGSLFDGCDLVLVEGMKSSELPKVLVNRADNPRGVLPCSCLANVVLSLHWPSLPEVWDEPAANVAEIARSLLQSPARRRASGVTGVVLAGGESRRMGSDKARLRLRGCDGTWLERAFLLLAERCRPVWIAGRIVDAGGGDLPLLRHPVLSHLDLRVGWGPLGGIETALAVARGGAVLVVPCDAPELPGDALDRLLEERGGSPAIAYRHPDGRREPLPLLAEPHVTEPLLRHLESGERHAGAFLDSIGTRWLPVTPSLAAGLASRNTPEDRRRYDGGA